MIELQKKIYEQNVKRGWWDKPRPFYVITCLFHSELSEAMEGDRKSLMDDKLKQYEMFHVELADFCIRVLDYLGSVGFSDYANADLFRNAAKMERLELLAHLHNSCSDAFENHTVNVITGYENLVLSSAVIGCFEYAEANDFDLRTIIDEKVAFNKTRLDHQRSERDKTNGKAY